MSVRSEIYYALNLSSLQKVLLKGALYSIYSDQDIEKILGANFIRVFKTVWKA